MNSPYIRSPIFTRSRNTLLEGDEQPVPWVDKRQAPPSVPMNIVAKLMIALPVACLGINALAWLLYGVDIPYWDDWRPYIFQYAGDLSLQTLFKPANDTLYPVGGVLDALAQKFLLGNSVAYQLLSLLFVLGSLLVLQWRLLTLVISDRLLAACAFSATLFMLQPGSYWGMQNVAYHQVLPLVALLYSLDVIYRQSWHGFRSPLALLIVGVLCGLTYISGAFAVLTAGLLILGTSFICGDQRRSSRIGGAILLFAGIVTSIPQGWVIASYQHGSHRPDAPIAYPMEMDFWMYLLGKVGRSLMLPHQYALPSLVVVAVALLVVFGSALHMLRIQWRHRHVQDNGSERLQQQSMFAIYLTLIGVTASYLLIVAAGRANLRDPAVTGALEIFSSGFPRFHYFWATILFPWIAAALMSCIGGLTRARVISLVGASLLAAFAIFSGVFSHFSYYRAAAESRLRGLECIRTGLEAARPLNCETLYPSTDLTAAINYADGLGATFTRSLTSALTMELGYGDGKSPVRPLVLGSVGTIYLDLPTMAIPASIGSIAVFVGTYEGASNGQLDIVLCQEQRCQKGAADINDAHDNDYIVVRFPQPLTTSAGSPLSISLSTSESTFPVAIWGYAAPADWTGKVVIRAVDGSIETPPAIMARVRMSTSG